MIPLTFKVNFKILLNEECPPEELKLNGTGFNGARQEICI